MAFHAGDDVHVAAFGKGIVREVRNGDRYLVEVKGRSMVVGAAQLTAFTRSKPSLPGEGAEAVGVPEPLRRSGVAASIDLHGRTAAEAVEAFDAFIDSAILAGHAEVSVIHGRSGGRVKGAVHRRLKQLPVRGFRLDPSNPGVTIVVL